MLTHKEFRNRAKNQQTVWTANAFDAMSAMLIERAGFDGVSTGGFAIAASFLGKPDLEIYTMTENLTVVRNVIDAVSCPVIADIDNGYGNVINIMRTVRCFEMAGAVGLTLEDQVAPKKCPMFGATMDVLPLDEAVARLRAALDARTNPDTMIIARTDCTEPREATLRGKAYAEAGADLIMPIGRTFKNIGELREFRRECGIPLSISINEGSPYDVSRADIESVAGRASYPLTPLLTVAQALKDNLAALRREHSFAALPHPRMEFAEMKELLGFDEVQRVHETYTGFLRGKS